MSTQTRLDAYLAAELEILSAQEFRGNDRTYRMAELDVVQKTIRNLETKLVRESRRSAGGSYLGGSVADLSQ